MSKTQCKKRETKAYLCYEYKNLKILDTAIVNLKAYMSILEHFSMLDAAKDSIWCSLDLGFL